MIKLIEINNYRLFFLKCNLLALYILQKKNVYIYNYILRKILKCLISTYFFRNIKNVLFETCFFNVFPKKITFFMLPVFRKKKKKWNNSRINDIYVFKDLLNVVKRLFKNYVGFVCDVLVETTFPVITSKIISFKRTFSKTINILIAFVVLVCVLLLSYKLFQFSFE